jgi:hypothetical protein
MRAPARKGWGGKHCVQHTSLCQRHFSCHWGRLLAGWCEMRWQPPAERPRREHSQLPGLHVAWTGMPHPGWQSVRLLCGSQGAVVCFDSGCAITGRCCSQFGGGTQEPAAAGVGPPALPCLACAPCTARDSLWAAPVDRASPGCVWCGCLRGGCCSRCEWVGSGLWRSVSGSAGPLEVLVGCGGDAVCAAVSLLLGLRPVHQSSQQQTTQHRGLSVAGTHGTLLPAVPGISLQAANAVQVAACRVCWLPGLAFLSCPSNTLPVALLCRRLCRGALVGSLCPGTAATRGGGCTGAVCVGVCARAGPGTEVHSHFWFSFYGPQTAAGECLLAQHTDCAGSTGWGWRGV